jgi:hypothetical protein
MPSFGDYAESRTDRAADRTGPDELTGAIGEGLSAVAYALLGCVGLNRDRLSMGSGITLRPESA